MAYNLGARFPPPPKYFTLLDPGAYQGDKRGRKQNAAPFLSKTPRNTQGGIKLWTEAIYDQSLPRNIPNCSSMLSKRPRFPYESFSAEDLEEILCKCGIPSPCECPTGQETQVDICQGKVRRHIFKGPAPRSVLGDEGLSTPSRYDHGFNITNDNSQHRIREEVKEKCPPFYDARVNESTAFYQGCKWSKRTSMRVLKHLEVKPGPADYFLEREPTKDEICAEKNRAFKRKTSKQLRFIEMVQQKNILEDLPGPATYNPLLPKGTYLQFTGAKAKRFPTSKYDMRPGPADHWLRRDFDPLKPPDTLCQANLSEPPCFGTKANRFGSQREEGPSPATYNVNLRLCNFVNCRNAPFGSSAKRFKEENLIVEYQEEETVEPLNKGNEEKTAKQFIKPTWQFKSKTIRIKPLVKKIGEPCPPDLPQTRNIIERSAQSQFTVPFSSSERRFMPWYSWIPVHGIVETPGPASYCLEKPKCLPAFKCGPLYRAIRFPNISPRAPSPNAYKVNNGIETVLSTHNKRLKCNMEHHYKYHEKQPKSKKILSYEERETYLLKKCITLLESDEVVLEKPPENLVKDVPVTPKPKMLRSFLYANPLPKYS